MKSEKDLLSYIIHNNNNNINKNDVCKVYEGFFRYVQSKLDNYKFVQVPELGTFHNKVFEMTTVEKKLAKINPAIIQTEFYPAARLISRGKFKNFVSKPIESFNDTSTWKTQISSFSKYSKQGFAKKDKYLVGLESVAQICDMSTESVKQNFRLIIDNLILLKDHYDFQLNIKIGNIYVNNDSIYFKQKDNLINIETASNSSKFSKTRYHSTPRSSYHKKYIFDKENDFNESEYSNISNMSAMEKMMYSDYHRRQIYMRQSFNKTPQKPTASFPFFSGMVSGYENERTQSIKVYTDLPLSNYEFQSSLEQQKFNDFKNKLDADLKSKIEERKLINNDIISMKKYLYEQKERRQINKDELIFHNTILKKTKDLKDAEESNYRKYTPKEYFPFINGDTYVEDRQKMNNTLLNTKISKVSSTPINKQIIYDKWVGHKPIYERVPTPDDKVKKRMGINDNKQVVIDNASERNDIKIINDKLNERKVDKDIKIRQDQELLNDLQNKYKRRLVNIKYKDYIQKQKNENNEKNIV